MSDNGRCSNREITVLFPLFLLLLQSVSAQAPETKHAQMFDIVVRVPTTLSEAIPLGLDSLMFQDSASGFVWFAEQKNKGLVGSAPPIQTFAKEAAERMGANKDNIRVTRSQMDEAVSAFATYQANGDEWAMCAAWWNSTIYMLGGSGPAAQKQVLQRQVRTACESARFKLPEVPETTTGDAVRDLGARLPGAQALQPMVVEGAILSLWDPEMRYTVKLIRYPREGSPYEGAKRSTLPRMLAREGCTQVTVTRWKTDGKKGWRARCIVPNPNPAGLDDHILTHVLQTDDSVWLVTVWGLDIRWDAIEAYANRVLADAFLP
jgi:hypothetical protein